MGPKIRYPYFSESLEWPGEVEGNSGLWGLRVTVGVVGFGVALGPFYGDKARGFEFKFPCAAV